VVLQGTVNVGGAHLYNPTGLMPLPILITQRKRPSGDKLKLQLEIFDFKSNLCSSHQTVAIMGIRVLPYSSSIWKRDRATVIKMS